MEYRMTTVNVKAGENMIDQLVKDLKEDGYAFASISFPFIGFEALPGTKFYLNEQKKPMLVPSNGNFATPFFGNGGSCLISKLVFEEDFAGNVYYII